MFHSKGSALNVEKLTCFCFETFCSGRVHTLYEVKWSDGHRPLRLQQNQLVYWRNFYTAFLSGMHIYWSEKDKGFLKDRCETVLLKSSTKSIRRYIKKRKELLTHLLFPGCLFLFYFHITGTFLNFQILQLCT